MTDDVSNLRPRMMSVAYRLLGSVADAEDAVQDAFLRYQTVDDAVAAVTVNPDKLARWAAAEVE